MVNVPRLFLNNSEISTVDSHKHLGIVFNRLGNWNDHITSLSTKAMKSVALLRRIQYSVPRTCLEILYKSFVRPILEYGGIIFDSAPEVRLQELEKIQRICALICTGAYKHTPQDRLLRELGWEPLSLRRRNQRLSIMYKIQNGLSPNYLIQLCNNSVGSIIPYNTRNRDNLRTYSGRTKSLLSSYFPRTVNDWNNLTVLTRSAPSLNAFKTNLKKLSGYKVNKLFSYGKGSSRINYTRLRLGFSGLNKHRFDVNFINYSDCPKCNYQSEDCLYYFFDCQYYNNERKEFLIGITRIIYPGVHYSLIVPDTMNDKLQLLNIVLCGSNDLMHSENMLMFDLAQKYIADTKKF